ncbi:MAG: DUF4885 family protein [Eubacteriales bacterium]
MKINGFGKEFGVSRTHETRPKDQDKQTKEKNSTTKPQEKGDTYSISPEARARMGAKTQGSKPDGHNVTEEKPHKKNNSATVLPSDSTPTTLPNHGETLMQELELETAVEGKTLYLTSEQAEVQATQSLVVSSAYELYGVLGPKQDIEGSYTGDYANNSWETTFPPHNPPEWTNTVEYFDNFMAYNQSVRDDISDSINKLLKDNNVVIPEGVEFDISVDPYDYKIHVTGVDGQALDPELEKQIEDALNKGDNGKNLYDHINYVNKKFNLYDPDTLKDGVEFKKHYLYPELSAWSEEHAEGQNKLTVMKFVEEYTGFNFDELEHRDGAWYTPDGENAWSVASKNFLSKAAESGELSGAVQVLSPMGEYYQKMAQGGFDALEDRNLSITYSGGKLYDYGSSQGIGEGQDDWSEVLGTEYKKESEAMAKYQAGVDERIAKLEANKTKPNNFNEVLSDDWEEHFMELVRADMGKSSTTSGEVTSVEELLKQLMNNGNTQQQTLLDTLLSNKS